MAFAKASKSEKKIRCLSLKGSGKCLFCDAKGAINHLIFHCAVA
jgi:hypothetical protein